MNLVASIESRHKSRYDTFEKLLKKEISKFEDMSDRDDIEHENEKTFTLNRITKLMESMSKNDELIIKLIESISKHFDKIFVDVEEEEPTSFENPLSD